MRYWEVITSDNQVMTELKDKWEDVKGIEQLSFVIEDKEGRNKITLPRGMDSYHQAKSASLVVGSKGVQIESRYIAFKKGNIIVRVRIDEQTNNISIECDESK